MPSVRATGTTGTCCCATAETDARVDARQRDFLRDFAEQFDELRHVVLVAVVRLPTDDNLTAVQHVRYAESSTHRAGLWIKEQVARRQLEHHARMRPHVTWRAVLCAEDHLRRAVPADC